MAGRPGPTQSRSCPQDHSRKVFATTPPDFALTARANDSAIPGLARFRTSQGSLANALFGDLRRHYGLFGALWPADLLSALAGKPEPNMVQLDGFCLAPKAQWRSVGPALLTPIKRKARETGATCLCPDLFDAGPRARTVKALRFLVSCKGNGSLASGFGFNDATRMEMMLS